MCVVCSLALRAAGVRSICATSYYASYFPVGPPVVWCLCGSYVLLRVRSALHLVATCLKIIKTVKKPKLHYKTRITGSAEFLCACVGVRAPPAPGFTGAQKESARAQEAAEKARSERTPQLRKKPNNTTQKKLKKTGSPLTQRETERPPLQTQNQIPSSSSILPFTRGPPGRARRPPRGCPRSTGASSWARPPAPAAVRGFRPPCSRAPPAPPGRPSPRRWALPGTRGAPRRSRTRWVPLSCVFGWWVGRLFEQRSSAAAQQCEECKTQMAMKNMH